MHLIDGRSHDGPPLLQQLRALALVAICFNAPVASASAGDDVFCNGFDAVSACPAVPFMTVPNRAWIFASTPFSTYLSTSATATSLVLKGPSAQTVIVPVSGQAGNRVDSVIAQFTLPVPGLWSVQVTTLGSPAESPQPLLITGTPGGLALASASPSVVSNKGLARVTLFATDPAPVSTEGFVAMPEVFLQPHGSAANAVRIADRDFVSPGRLAVAIPAGTASGVYDVVAINADGATGVLNSGLTISANAAPVVTRHTPERSVDQTGQVIKLYGANFGAGAPAVSATCVDSLGSSVGAPLPGNVTASDATSASVTFDFSALAIGDACRLDLTTTDGQVASFANQAISGSGLNLGPTSDTGQTLLQGRRGGVLLAGPVAAEGHRLYMIGGDNGTSIGAMASVESAAIGAFGALGAFRVETHSLPQPLTFAGGVTAGDYLYIIGGNNGSGQVSTAYRSRVLRDLRDPAFATLGAIPAPAAGQGLGPGLWRYRVAPLISAADTDNPSGEGLPGAELSVEVPATQNGVQVVLTFATTITNVTDYAIYRSPTAGAATFNRLAVVPNAGASTTYTDTGGATNPSVSPMPIGSLANWYALPSMGSNREGAAVAVAQDPVTAGTGYVYAIAGRTGPATTTTSYEYLSFTTAADGRQTSAAMWTPGASGLGAGREYLGAWTANADNAPGIIAANDTYIFAGPGVVVSGVGSVDAGKVAAGGDLGVWDATPTDVPGTHYGYSTAQADNGLYIIGGASGMPSTGVIAAYLTSPPPKLAVAAWNSEGANLVHGVVFAGSATTDGFIYIAGGQTDVPSAADTFVQRIQQ